MFGFRGGFDDGCFWLPITGEHGERSGRVAVDPYRRTGVFQKESPEFGTWESF